MKMQAKPARAGELDRLHRFRRAVIQHDADRREAARNGLIYTATGVIDMTRTHKPTPPAPEEIVGRIGGAKTW